MKKLLVKYSLAIRKIEKTIYNYFPTDQEKRIYL